jgi:HPt (histidine-containing phosphotransfer) domain-containing protein
MRRRDGGQEDSRKAGKTAHKPAPALPQFLSQQAARLQVCDQATAPSPWVYQREKDQEERQVHRIGRSAQADLYPDQQLDH